MKVIDENGRVFGIINVVDLLVVLLLLAVLSVGAALVIGGDAGDDQQTESVTFTVEATDIQPYVADALPSPGELDDGNVTRIENASVEPATVLTTNASGAVLTREHPRLKTVTLTVTVDAQRIDGTYHVGNQGLKVGHSVRLDLGTVSLRGRVTALEAPA